MEDNLPIHEQSFRGLTWFDMPGCDYEDKKLSFSLFRRGLYDPVNPNDIFNHKGDSTEDSEEEPEKPKVPHIPYLYRPKPKGPRPLHPTVQRMRNEARARRLAREESSRQAVLRQQDLTPRFNALNSYKGFLMDFLAICNVTRNDLHRFRLMRLMDHQRLDLLEAAIIHFENDRRSRDGDAVIT